MYQAFGTLGMSLSIDGSCDSEIHINGLAGLQVGDWRQEGGATIEKQANGGLQNNSGERGNQEGNPLENQENLENEEDRELDIDDNDIDGLVYDYHD